MPRKNATEKATEEVVKDEGSKEEKAVVPAPVPSPVVVRVSFEQWATRRRVPDRHKGGMRAFVKNVNRPRSLEEWDKIFASY